MPRGLETVQTPDARERIDARERLDANERYLIATFNRSGYAVPLSLIDRIVRQPKVQAWQGSGVVQGFVFVEGWVVWLLDAGQVFVDLQRTNSVCDWLLVMKEDHGLSRIGVLADEVKGPVAFARIEHARILQRRRVDEAYELR